MWLNSSPLDEPSKVPWVGEAMHDTSQACRYPWQPSEWQPRSVVTLINQWKYLPRLDDEDKKGLGEWGHKGTHLQQARKENNERKRGCNTIHLGPCNNAQKFKPLMHGWPNLP